MTADRCRRVAPPAADPRRGRQIDGMTPLSFQGTTAGRESRRVMRTVLQIWRYRAVRALVAGLLIVGAPAVALGQTERVEYYALDAIGSVRVVFDASGNIVGRMDYGPFGMDLNGATGMPPERFAGLTRDGEAGLDYAQARSYQVRTGRFTAPDPVYAGLFDPQQWNRYTYGRSNPLTYVDPTGLMLWFCWGCIYRYYETVTVAAYDPPVMFDGWTGGGAPSPSFEWDAPTGGGGVGVQVPPPSTDATPPPDQPPPRVPPDTPKELVVLLADAISNADKRLERPRCSKLFGGIDIARPALHNANYRFYDLRGPRVAPGATKPSVVGAATIREANVIALNSRGPFVQQTLFVPGYGQQTFDGETGLRGSDFRALVLLHELGHLTTVFGPDAGNPALNQQYTNEVYRGCF